MNNLPYDSKSIFDVPSINWGKQTELILKEGFYFYGGKVEEDFISEDLYILRPVEKKLDDIDQSEIPFDFPSNPLIWEKETSTSGVSPGKLYSHCMHYYRPHNCILIYGGKT